MIVIYVKSNQLCKTKTQTQHDQGSDKSEVLIKQFAMFTAWQWYCITSVNEIR